MNYKIVGRENRTFGPYTLSQLENFQQQGKLRPNMCLIDENGNKHFAKDIVNFTDNNDTVDLTYLSNSTNTSNRNNDYVDLTDLSDDISNNQITYRNYTQNNSNDYADLTNDDYDNKYTMIGSDGREYGPYSIDELQRFVSENRVAPDTILIDSRGQRLQAKDLLTFPNNSYSYSNNSYGNNSYSNNSFGNNSGMGSRSTLPPHLSGLNWGAFFLPLFWGISHNTWLALACLLPSVGWIISFILLFKGNEWAWQNRIWTSEHEFLLVQKVWYNWGVGITIAGAIMGLTPFLFIGCGI